MLGKWGHACRIDSGLGWALLYSMPICKSLPSVVIGPSVIGLKFCRGITHRPGHYLYSKHPERF